MNAPLPKLAKGPVVPGHGDVVDSGFVEELRDEMAGAIAHDGDPAAGPYPEATMRVVRERVAVEAARGSQPASSR